MKKKNGFSLLEILVVLSIFGIMAAFVSDVRRQRNSYHSLNQLVTEEYIQEGLAKVKNSIEDFTDAVNIKAEELKKKQRQ